jgi:hypothetical protein
VRHVPQPQFAVVGASEHLWRSGAQLDTSDPAVVRAKAAYRLRTFPGSRASRSQPFVVIGIVFVFVFVVTIARLATPNLHKASLSRSGDQRMVTVLREGKARCRTLAIVSRPSVSATNDTAKSDTHKNALTLDTDTQNGYQVPPVVRGAAHWKLSWTLAGNSVELPVARRAPKIDGKRIRSVSRVAHVRATVPSDAIRLMLVFSFNACSVSTGAEESDRSDVLGGVVLLLQLLSPRAAGKSNSTTVPMGTVTSTTAVASSRRREDIYEREKRETSVAAQT